MKQSKTDDIKIAIIDDHDLFREGMILVLNQIEGFKVIYDTADANEFLSSFQKLRPDVVLMDISMPGMEGITATRKALEINPELKVIALTMFSDETHYTLMINAGAKGFMLKSGKKYELQQAITNVYNGGNFFSMEILQKLSLRSINGKESNDLTVREIEILNLLCTGKTTREIADKLFISPKTVESHKTNIFEKTSVRNSAELIIWAVKNNYISIE